MMAALAWCIMARVVAESSPPESKTIGFWGIFSFAVTDGFMA